jgi:hypothetical protein
MSSTFRAGVPAALIVDAFEMGYRAGAAIWTADYQT